MTTLHMHGQAERRQMSPTPAREQHNRIRHHNGGRSSRSSATARWRNADMAQAARRGSFETNAQPSTSAVVKLLAFRVSAAGVRNNAANRTRSNVSVRRSQAPRRRGASPRWPLTPATLSMPASPGRQPASCRTQPAHHSGVMRQYRPHLSQPERSVAGSSCRMSDHAMHSKQHSISVRA